MTSSNRFTLLNRSAYIHETYLARLGTKPKELTKAEGENGIIMILGFIGNVQGVVTEAYECRRGSRFKTPPERDKQMGEKASLPYLTLTYVASGLRLPECLGD